MLAHRTSKKNNKKNGGIEMTTQRPVCIHESIDWDLHVYQCRDCHKSFYDEIEICRLIKRDERLRHIQELQQINNSLIHCKWTKSKKRYLEACLEESK